MKLLTVTVPCYNSQDYMEKCIDSLLTGGNRVEIIIINDGSKDHTGDIADRYAAQHPDIVRVIHQENGGHGEGINQGLRHATGTYFKVVDSDDCVSEDFPAFLDALESCEQRGGVDALVTNYFYTHTDGIGDRAIHYRNCLPQDALFTWEDTRRFRIHQMLTLHSCTFRTELMRRWPMELPKLTFYEDNLMDYMTLPHVQTLYYTDRDLYRYTIGREGQSVQMTVSMRRYAQQIAVTEKCFTSCHLDDIKQPKLRRYMKHDLLLMLGISVAFARLNKTDEADNAVQSMWKACKDFDKKQANRYRYGSPLFFMCIPGKIGRNVLVLIYRLANKVVRYN